MKYLIQLLIATMWLIHGLAVAAEYPAVLDWADKSLVAFPVTGVVQSLHAQPGETVKKGQLLARMDSTPFMAEVDKYKANIARIQPLLTDAARELEHAQELFDQTVLSVVELQKVEAVHQRLLAEDQLARAELTLAQWRVDKTQLRASYNGRLVSTNLLPGMVISKENQSQVGLVLAATSSMQAVAKVNAGQLRQLSVGQAVEVVIDDTVLAGQIRAISHNEERSGEYQLIVTFKTKQVMWAGRAARVRD